MDFISTQHHDTYPFIAQATHHNHKVLITGASEASASQQRTPSREPAPHPSPSLPEAPSIPWRLPSSPPPKKQATRRQQSSN
ncbi:hypothetical protein HCH54_010139 [Aspergillus fumigatus]